MAAADGMRIWKNTDTGTGYKPGATTSSKSMGSGATNTSQLVKQTSPYQSNTSKIAANKSTASTASKKTTTSAASKSNDSQAVAGTSRKKYYTYSSPSYSSSYQGTAASQAETPVDNSSKNWNAYLKLLNETYNNEYKQIKQNAQNYQNTAAANLADAEAQYTNAYNTNKAALDQLAQNNAAREKAIMDTINAGYNNQMTNAQNYYNSLIDTYNRSMGYVDQGFNEGNEATARARDEAIELAAQLYAMGEETQQRQTEKDLKGQYVSYMKGMKNMNQRLASMGINGGAAETTLLGALNGYEANRTDLEEARQAALGQLRQQQMQSDSEAQQAYLNKLAELISNRTNQQLGVEQNRSTGEYNYAGMKNSAESERTSNTSAAQNNFQSWASDLTKQRSDNENNYATAKHGIADSKNTAAYNTANMQNQAAANKSANYSSNAYLAGVDELSKKNAKASVQKTKKQKEKEKKAKEKEKKKTTTTKKTTKKK